jgi:hypothetical protein
MSLVTALISSFDGYSECWGPVCHGFKKYWPDCPSSMKFTPDRIEAIAHDCQATSVPLKRMRIEIETFHSGRAEAALPCPAELLTRRFPLVHRM